MTVTEMLVLFQAIERHKRDARELVEVLEQLLDRLEDGSPLHKVRRKARAICRRTKR